MNANRRRRKVAQLIDRDGLDCHVCGERMLLGVPDVDQRRVSLDHLVPVNEGGGNELSNLKLAHQHCNQERNMLRPAEVRERERSSGRGV